MFWKNHLSVRLLKMELVRPSKVQESSWKLFIFLMNIRGLKFKWLRGELVSG